MNITEYIIELRDIHLFAHHGVLPQEQQIGAHFTINMTLKIKDHRCIACDDLSKTVSYADVYEIIKAEMKKPSKLLENICNRIMQSIFEKFNIVEEIKISLYKDTPPMGGDRLKAGVTIKGIK